MLDPDKEEAVFKPSKRIQRTPPVAARLAPRFEPIEEEEEEEISATSPPEFADSPFTIQAQIGQDTPVVLSLRLKAELFLSKDYNTSFAMSFNGDDALSLDKLNATTSKYDLVDIFGKIGERPVPGWSDKEPYTGTGIWYSVDKTLIRKPNVLTGLDTLLKGVYVAVNPKLYFNPTIEWNLNPRDMFDSLGFHNCNCNLSNTKHIENNVIARIFPNPASNQLFINTSMDVAQLEILNNNGQKMVADWTISNNNQIQMISVNLSQFSEGIYTVNLIS